MTRHQLRALPMVVLLVVLLVVALVGAPDSRPLARSPADTPGDAAWVATIEAVDNALAANDIRRGARAAQEAYRAALASRQWPAMLAVGDAYVRIGEAAGLQSPARARARESYLAAIYRAQEAGSLEGVVRGARAFHALGDRDVALMCLRIANRMTKRQADREGQAQVSALTEQFASHTDASRRTE